MEAAEEARDRVVLVELGVIRLVFFCGERLAREVSEARNGGEGWRVLKGGWKVEETYVTLLGVNVLELIPLTMTQQMKYCSMDPLAAYKTPLLKWVNSNRNETNTIKYLHLLPLDLSGIFCYNMTGEKATILPGSYGNTA